LGVNESNFKKNMSKQSTQETGVQSNGGSTIRFGGSFKKNSGGKGNFDEHIYSDIKKKGNINKVNNEMGSNIRIHNEDSEEEDPMSFLDDILNGNPTQSHGTMSHTRKNPQMHKDAQQLRHYYDDNPLTVVSEEASTRQTVILGNNLSKRNSNNNTFPFESDITSSPSPISGHGLTHFQKNKNGFNFSQKSGENSLFKGSGNQGSNSEIVFRMNRTKSAYLNPNMNKKEGQPFGRRSTQAKSMTEMDDIEEQSKHEISQDSGNLIPHSPIMRVASEGTQQIQRRTFLPDDNDMNSNIQNKRFFGKLQPFKPHIEEYETNSLEESLNMNSDSIYKNLKTWTSLPMTPDGPNYEITFLNGISNKKSIHKKQGLVENMIFKLSDKGLYYDGSLSFGKLKGNGMLLLNMVDTSDLSSPEVKKNLLYKGEFNENMVQGKGVIYFKNNARFEGSFTKGVAHGTGKLFTSKGQIISGIWLEGKLRI
jgi:hypothetical protein